MNQPPIIKPPSTWRSIIVAIKVTAVTVLAFFAILAGSVVIRIILSKLL